MLVMKYYTIHAMAQTVNITKTCFNNHLSVMNRNPYSKSCQSASMHPLFLESTCITVM